MSCDLPYARISGGVTAPQGFQASAVSCGIKNPDADRLDLGLLVSDHPVVSHGMFTINRVKAAPVRVTQAHQRVEELRAVIVNSGNANACTGPDGTRDARNLCKAISKRLGLKQREVGVCSTGVIGLPLPMVRIEPHYDELVERLSPQGGHDLSLAIITSDTHEKEFALNYEFEGKTITIGGCTKGAGMINPNMATMLAFITTDAAISKACLVSTMEIAVENTFNRISIDGDMSTNDSVLVQANGAAGNDLIRRGSKACDAFAHALEFLMLRLAKSIVRDGERVTKFVTVKVQGARTRRDARKVAQAVVNSSLVKCSWNGGDPNWGRIIHAVGYSGASIKEELIDIYFGELQACAGGLQSEVDPDEIRKVVAEEEFTITIDLNLKDASHTIYTADLSPEYVDFNRSEYAYWMQARKDGLIK